MNSCQTPYHAWYSAENKRLSGSVWYQTPEGNAIEVTEVSENPDSISGWSDKVYLGLVTYFISTEKRSSFRGLYPHNPPNEYISYIL